LAETEERPLVTFALFAYNQERYIAEAMAGAFAQDYSPLEIILSDDCSTDSTFEIMQRMAAGYQGPHKIVLNRNERNLGITAHVNRVFSLISGSLVVFAAGDDISFPSRTSDIVKAWIIDNKETECIFSDYVKINDNGEDISSISMKISYDKTPEERIKHGVVIFGAVTAWNMRIIRNNTPIPDILPSEDLELSLRAFLGGGFTYVPRTLVRYRIHVANWSSGASTFRKGKKLSESSLLAARYTYSFVKKEERTDLIKSSLDSISDSEYFASMYGNNINYPYFLYRTFKMMIKKPKNTIYHLSSSFAPTSFSFIYKLYAKFYKNNVADR